MLVPFGVKLDNVPIGGAFDLSFISVIIGKRLHAPAYPDFFTYVCQSNPILMMIFHLI
jgi:hypothetical protein